MDLGTNQRHLPIPEVREKLYAIADHMEKMLPGTRNWANDIRELADATKRKPAARRTRKKLPGLTAELAQNIRDFARANPDLSSLDIAFRFGTNPGRVSEAINGHM